MQYYSSYQFHSSAALRSHTEKEYLCESNFGGFSSTVAFSMKHKFLYVHMHSLGFRLISILGDLNSIHLDASGSGESINSSMS